MDSGNCRCFSLFLFSLLNFSSIILKNSTFLKPGMNEHTSVQLFFYKDGIKKQTKTILQFLCSSLPSINICTTFPYNGLEQWFFFFSPYRTFENADDAEQECTTSRPTTSATNPCASGLENEMANER